MTQEQKINIAELLKDCPKGMELDCTMFDDVKFIEIEDDDKPICIRTGDIYRYLTKFGTWTFDENAKCVIFPKGKTTWEGFQRPFKDGDILVDVFGNIVIYKGEINHNKKLVDYYCGYRRDDNAFIVKRDKDSNFGHIKDCQYATEEEKEKIFDAIKANGYKWNSETKTLEKLLKFKVGNRIKEKDSNKDAVLITEIADNYYVVETKYGMEVTISIDIQNNYELVPNKFDITTLKPFDKVLVRENGDGEWGINFFGFYNYDEGYYYTTGNWMYKQCIPYEGNEYLLGTTDNCDNFYKTW